MDYSFDLTINKKEWLALLDKTVTLGITCEQIRIILQSKNNALKWMNEGQDD